MGIYESVARATGFSIPVLLFMSVSILLGILICCCACFCPRENQAGRILSPPPAHPPPGPPGLNPAPDGTYPYPLCGYGHYGPYFYPGAAPGPPGYGWTANNATQTAVFPGLETPQAVPTTNVEVTTPQQQTNLNV